MLHPLSSTQFEVIHLGDGETTQWFRTLAVLMEYWRWFTAPMTVNKDSSRAADLSLAHVSMLTHMYAHKQTHTYK